MPSSNTERRSPNAEDRPEEQQARGFLSGLKRLGRFIRTGIGSPRTVNRNPDVRVDDQPARTELMRGAERTPPSPHPQSATERLPDDGRRKLSPLQADHDQRENNRQAQTAIPSSRATTTMRPPPRLSERAFHPMMSSPRTADTPELAATTRAVDSETWLKKYLADQDRKFQDAREKLNLTQPATHERLPPSKVTTILGRENDSASSQSLEPGDTSQETRLPALGNDTSTSSRSDAGSARSLWSDDRGVPRSETSASSLEQDSSSNHEPEAQLLELGTAKAVKFGRAHVVTIAPSQEVTEQSPKSSPSQIKGEARDGLAEQSGRPDRGLEPRSRSYTI